MFLYYYIYGKHLWASTRKKKLVHWILAEDLRPVVYEFNFTAVVFRILLISNFQAIIIIQKFLCFFQVDDGRREWFWAPRPESAVFPVRFDSSRPLFWAVLRDHLLTGSLRRGGLHLRPGLSAGRRTTTRRRHPNFLYVCISFIIPVTINYT